MQLPPEAVVVNSAAGYFALEFLPIWRHTRIVTFHRVFSVVPECHRPVIASRTISIYDFGLSVRLPTGQLDARTTAIHFEAANGAFLLPQFDKSPFPFHPPEQSCKSIRLPGISTIWHGRLAARTVAVEPASSNRAVKARINRDIVNSL